MPSVFSNAVTPSSTTTFTNKSYDANGTGNALSNVDVADIANGTDGNLITWDAAGAPAVVATGTAAQVLTSNGAGAAPTFQAGGGTAASQAEQETGTATNVYVSPGRQQFHQSAVKMWTKMDGTGTAAIDASYNTTSITDNGTGDYTFNIATDFSSGEYAYGGSAGEVGQGSVVINGSHTSDPVAGSFRIIVGTSGMTPADRSNVSVWAMGDQ